MKLRVLKRTRDGIAIFGFIFRMARRKSVFLLCLWWCRASRPGYQGCCGTLPVLQAAALYIRALLGGIKRTLEIYRRVDETTKNYPWSVPTREEKWHCQFSPRPESQALRPAQPNSLSQVGEKDFPAFLLCFPAHNFPPKKIGPFCQLN